MTSTSQPGGGPPLRTLIFRIYAPSLLYAVGRGSILPVIALSARGHGSTVAEAALVITLMGVGSLITNIPASLLIARLGERTAMIGAALWASVGMAVCLGAGHLAPYAAGVLMIGMAGSVFNLSRQSYLTEAVPVTYRARAMSGLGGTLRVGLFVGPFVGAATMHFLGLQGAYWAGLVAMVAAAGVCIGIPELQAPAGSGRPERGETGAAPVPRTATVTLRAILAAHWRTYATIGSAIVVISAVRATRQAVIPLWAEHLGMDASATSLVYGLSGAVDMLVFYPAGVVMDRRGRTWIAVPCMVVMGVSLALMPFTTGPGTLLLVAMLLGLGNGIGSGLVMTLGADHSPSVGRPQFLGFWRLISDVGVLSGPVLLSAVTAMASLGTGVFAIAALSFAGGGLFAWFIPRKAPPGSLDARRTRAS
ncbi:MAG: MFS transporter [Arthrobacter sp.]|uniref:MFS transporter n=1 Tax=unclassified Arthrobacter TaxID=235627 RepID=UPI003FB9768F